MNNIVIPNIIEHQDTTPNVLVNIKQLTKGIKFKDRVSEAICTINWLNHSVVNVKIEHEGLEPYNQSLALTETLIGFNCGEYILIKENGISNT